MSSIVISKLVSYKCFQIRMGKWGKYEKQYCPSWEDIPLFKGWLKRSPDDDNFAYCVVCKCSLRPQKNDLEKHSKSRKHILNASKLSKTQSNLTSFGFTPPFKKSVKINELKLAIFTATHSSLSSVNHLSEIVNDVILSSSCEKNKSWISKENHLRMQVTKCSAIIKKVNAPVLLEAMINDIGQSFFLLLLTNQQTCQQQNIYAFASNTIIKKKIK